MQNKKNIEKTEKSNFNDVTKKSTSSTNSAKKEGNSGEKQNETESKKNLKPESKKLEELTLQLIEKEEKIEELKKAILYEKAELENYRKRAFKERMDMQNFLKKDLILQFLPIVDNLERAAHHMGKSSKESIEEGIAMTLALFKEALGRFNVSSFKSLGEKFNPELQEAMTREESSEVEEDTVTQVFLKGYKMGDLLLRPAQVVVSYKPNKEEKTNEQDINEKNEQ